MRVLPVTVASAADQSTILRFSLALRSLCNKTHMAGKLKGVMAAQTPRGNRREYVSMSRATSSLSPSNVDVMAVADSTTYESADVVATRSATSQTHLESTMHVAVRVRDCLALLQDDRLRNLGRMLPDEVLQPAVSTAPPSGSQCMFSE
jgi:hypothetical protein